MICLDTSFIIDFLKERKEAIEFMKKNTEEVFTTEVNVFEIFIGIYTKEDYEREVKKQKNSIENPQSFKGAHEALR